MKKLLLVSAWVAIVLLAGNGVLLAGTTTIGTTFSGSMGTLTGGTPIGGSHANTTKFDITETDGTPITLTAPLTTYITSDYKTGRVGTWRKWYVNGASSIGIRTYTYAMNSTTTLITADLNPVNPTFTIQSTPFTGVVILAPRGGINGTTNYAKAANWYSNDTYYVLTAPMAVTNGGTDYILARWTLNGTEVPMTSGTLCAFTLPCDGSTMPTPLIVVEYEVPPMSDISVGNRWNGAAALTTNGTPITGTHPGTTRYTASVLDGSAMLLSPLAPTETYMPTTYAGGRVGALRKWYINGSSTGGSLTKTLTYTVTADASIDVDMVPANITFTIQSTPITGVTVTSVRGLGTGTTNFTTTQNWKSDTTYYVARVPQIVNDGGTDYEAKRWTLNGTEVPSVNGTWCAFTIPFNATTLPTPLVVIEYGTPTWALNVSSTPVTGVSITGTPAGTTNYSTRLDRDSAVTLTAPASYAVGNVDYTFVQWTGQSAGVLTYAFTLTADTDATAEYEVVARALDVTSTPVTGISITGSHAGTTDYATSVDDDTAITLVAPAAYTGYPFVQWTLNSTSQGANTTVTFNITEDTTALAEYSTTPVQLVYVNSTPSVSITGTPAGTTNYLVAVDDASAVSMTAPATASDGDTDYTFVKWTKDGSDLGSSQTITFTAATGPDATCEAEYTAVLRSVDVKSTPSGVAITGSPSGTTDYNTDVADNDSVTLLAPATVNIGGTDYGFVKWTVDGTAQPEGQATVAYNVNADTTATATYDLLRTLTVNSTPAADASITGTHAGTTNYTASVADTVSVTLTAPAAYATGGTNYTFLKWTLNGAPQGGSTTVAFAISGDTTAVAEYAITRVLTVQSTPGTGLSITGTNPGTTNYTADLANGAVATLTAPASYAVGAVDYTFVKWTVAGTAQTAGELTVAITMDANITAVAEYVIIQHTVHGETTPWPAMQGLKTGSSDPYPALGSKLYPFDALIDDEFYVKLVGAPTKSGGPTGIDGTFYRWILNGTDQPVGARSLRWTVNADASVVCVMTIDQRTVSVKSTPITGVSITVSPIIGAVTTDYTSGDVDDGTLISLEAPVTDSGYSLVRWSKNNTYSPNPTDQNPYEVYVSEWFDAVPTIQTDFVVTAEYAVTRTLTVQSTSISGVPITGSPSWALGSTDYAASVGDGAAVLLKAPAIFTDPSDSYVEYTLEKWILNGADQTAGETSLSFTLSADTTAVADYSTRTVRTVNVKSTPDVGAAITGSASGTTDFAADLAVGSDVTLTAPVTFTAGDGTDYDFVRWDIDTVDQSDDVLTVEFTADFDTVATAEYEITKRTLEVRSTSGRGITITGTAPGVTHYFADVDDNSTVSLTAPSMATVTDGLNKHTRYTFVRWMLDGVQKPAGVTVLTYDINGDNIAIAKYVKTKK